jgi:hypothetical protein
MSKRGANPECGEPRPAKLDPGRDWRRPTRDVVTGVTFRLDHMVEPLAENVEDRAGPKRRGLVSRRGPGIRLWFGLSQVVVSG